MCIDGPFGAPAVAYARYPVVLLVGAGSTRCLMTQDVLSFYESLSLLMKESPVLRGSFSECIIFTIFRV